MKRLSKLGLLVLVVACDPSTKITPPEPPQFVQSFCPKSFTWIYQTPNYEERALEITSNNFKMSLRPDSIITATGLTYIDLEVIAEGIVDTIPLQILAPFIGHYALVNKNLIISDGQTWLTASWVEHRFVRGNLATLSNDPDVFLKLIWEKCN